MNDPLVVEISRAGFRNQGAELMLRAAVSRLRDRYPGVRIAVEPGDDATFEERSSLALHQKLALRLRGLDLSGLDGLVPSKLRMKYGFVTNLELNAVFDASGFSYSDQWGAFGVRAAKALALSCRRWKAQGTRIFLLPQAFGPFKNPALARPMAAVLEHADLVFARDQHSFDQLSSLAGDKSTLRLAPDFTAELSHSAVMEDKPRSGFFIIPNARMVDSEGGVARGAYVDFLARVASYAHRCDQSPFFLIHEGEGDQRLAEEVAGKLSFSLKIVKEPDALRSKAVIGAARAGLSSRFHGLVSALSQAVPTLGTGWSHKYQALFAGYGFERGLLEVSCSDAELYSLMDDLFSPVRYEEIVTRLEGKGCVMQQQTDRMWDEIFERLDAPASQAAD